MAGANETSINISKKDLVQPIVEQLPVQSVIGVSGQVLVVSDSYKVIRPSIYVSDFSFEDLESFKLYVQQKIDETNGAIFWSHTELRAVKDLAAPNTAGKATYGWQKSNEVKDWLRALDMNHKQFRDFLQLHLDEVLDAPHVPGLPKVENAMTGLDLFTALTTLKLSANINFEATLDNSDQRTFGLVISQQGTRESTQIPRWINVRIPLFNNDEELYDIPFEIMFNQPNPDVPKVTFSVSSPFFQKIWEEAVKKKVTELKDSLNNHVFYFGNPRMEDVGEDLVRVKSGY